MSRSPILPRGSSRSRHHSLLHPWCPSLSRGGLRASAAYSNYLGFVFARTVPCRPHHYSPNPLYLGVGVYFLRKSTKNLRLSFLRMGVLRSRKRRLCLDAINVAFLVRSLVHPFPLKIRRQNRLLLYFYIHVVRIPLPRGGCVIGIVSIIIPERKAKK